jgi:putative ABC transport system substrate-binding protein
LSVVVILLLAALALGGCGEKAPAGPAPAAGEEKATQPEEQVHIGIMQIVEHPSLDAMRRGFMDFLAEHGYQEGKNVAYDYANAQGDMATAQTIAKQFVAQGVDLILAIATPTAQAAVNATRDRPDIPVVFTGITDPVAAGLVKSLEEPGGNATGMTDMIPVEKDLELVKKFRPEARRVGYLYNAGEVNSEVVLNIAREVAPKLGLEIVPASVTNSSEVKQAAESLVGRVDAVFIATDNTVVSALDSVLQVVEKNKIPLIMGDADSVRRGGLATYGIDYYKMGYQTGAMALRILQGADPATTPVEALEDLDFVINLQAAARQGVEVSEELRQQADELIQ